MSSSASSIELQLVPAPGQKPEFLATLESSSTVGSSFALWSKLVDDDSTTSSSSSSPLERVILEGYTRDAWALSFPTNGSNTTAASNHHYKLSTDKTAAAVIWQSLSVRSIDGRNKLPGFCTYLQQRNKVAYGRFNHSTHSPSGESDTTNDASTTSTTTTNNNNKMTGVWIVPPQKQSSNEVMTCWIAMDIRRIPNCTLVANQQYSGGEDATKQPSQPQQQPSETAAPVKRESRPPASSTNSKPTPTTSSSSSSKTSQPSSSSSSKRGGGLLGNLVGAQKRTNEHLSNAPAKKPDRIVINDDHDGTATSTQRTVTQVLDDFRQSIEQKLLDFDAEEHDTVLDISIRHADHIQGLHSQEEREKVSMEVLKYLVQEQAEEINEEWVVHQPPSEFLDEITLTIYKEAPPDILEEMNQGILPEEVRQQQRAIQSERQKAVNQAEAKRQAELRAMALRKASQQGGGDHDDDEDDDALAKLNTNKRDRRTVEDFQRQAAQQSKKNKSA